jgi:hypothetical protein
MMDQARKQWRPTPEEVDAIVAEMRPLLAEMAEMAKRRSLGAKPARRRAARTITCSHTR